MHGWLLQGYGTVHLDGVVLPPVALPATLGVAGLFVEAAPPFGPGPPGGGGVDVLPCLQ